MPSGYGEMIVWSWRKVITTSFPPIISCWRKILASATDLTTLTLCLFWLQQQQTYSHFFSISNPLSYM